jgi:hypothetical protein
LQWISAGLTLLWMHIQTMEPTAMGWSATPWRGLLVLTVGMVLALVGDRERHKV